MDPVLYSKEIGEGFPILIIPGWQMNGKAEALDFEPVFSKLSGFCRIYVDLPGMGRSFASNVKSLDDMFFHLMDFINSRLKNSRFLLAGSSCGGYIARAVAQKYIEQVDGLLLRVPVVDPRDNMRDLDAFEALFVDEQFMSSLPTEDRTLLGDVIVQTPEYVKLLKAKWDQAYTAAEGAADVKTLDPIRVDPSRYWLTVPLESEHAKFSAPTLFVCGRQDVEVGYRDALRLLKFYPRSTYIVLDRGTHALPVDEAGIFEALVRDWIMRVREWQDRSKK